MNFLVSEEQKRKMISAVRARAESHALHAVKYLDLGVCTVRILCYSPDIVPIVERELTYVLRDDAPRYDSTIIAWQDDDVEQASTVMCRQLPVSMQTHIHLERIITGDKYPLVFSTAGDRNGLPFARRTDRYNRFVELFDDENRAAYFCCESFEPESFSKHGHAFARLINHLIKTDAVNLTHGAVFGYAGNGFFLCGRGKRGKSTLTVESMLQGFEFVSDDYQILQKTSDGVFAWPIYSIITLSYRMYNEMYDRFLGKFVCNNFTMDKYLFNISAYHPQFRTRYPIRFCLFPEITPDEHPSIAACTPQQKGRAVVQMIHSTVWQMGDMGDRDTVRKLMRMIWDLPFVMFRLSGNIPENTEYLKDYLDHMPELLPDCSEPAPMLLDITDGLVYILDTRSFCLTEMNRFASNLFQLCLNGTDPDEIRSRLEAYLQYNPDILTEFDRLLELVKARNYASFGTEQCSDTVFLPDAARECEYSLSVNEVVGPDTVQHLKSK